MLLLRLLGLLAVATCVAACLLYLFTGNKKYLRLALRIISVSIALALVAFGLILLERLVVSV